MKSKNTLLFLLASASIITTGCGGTNPSLDTSNKISTTIGANTVLLAGETGVVTAQSFSSPIPLKEMKWSYVKLNNGPDLTLTNADCAQKSVNANSSALDPSTSWSCPIQITPPAFVTTEANYRFTVNTTDTKNNASSAEVTVTIKPTNSPTPTVNIISVDTVESGTRISFKCDAKNGVVQKTGGYSYQWLSDESAFSTTKLVALQNTPEEVYTTAPFVTKDTDFNVICRATDDFMKTGTVTKAIRITPPTNPIINAVVNNNGTSYLAGSNASLDGSASNWQSSSGAINPQAKLYYYWEQKQGTKVELLNSSAAVASVAFPTKTATGSSKRETYVFTLNVSDKPFVNGVSPGTVSKTDGVYFVLYTALISATVTPSQPVKSGTIGTATISALGASGQTIYYSWTQISGTTVSLASWNTSTVSFVAPTNNSPAPLVLMFRVAMDYSPITATNPGSYFVDVLVSVTP